MCKTVIDGHINAKARHLMHQAILDDPDLNATGLAERIADTLGHDDWLDDELHWIWDLAVQVCEWAARHASEFDADADAEQVAITGRIRR